MKGNLDKIDKCRSPVDDLEGRMERGNYVSGENGCEEWKMGFFRCGDTVVPNCLLSFFCGWIPLSQMYHRMNIMHFYIAVITFGIVFYIYGVLYCSNSLHGTFERNASYVIFVSGVFYLRVVVRRAWLIPGSIVEDFVLSFFCSCCSIAQMTYQLDLYKENECRCKIPSAYGKPNNEPVFIPVAVPIQTNPECTHQMDATS